MLMFKWRRWTNKYSEYKKRKAEEKYKEQQ